MKIGLFTDIHANLPALKVSLKRFRASQCDRIIHLGDMVGIGPYPKECLQLAHSIKEMEFIMGNHDYWYAFGLPNPIPKWMSEEEVAHQNWTHNQIGTEFKDSVKSWQFNINIEYSLNQKIVLRHYGLNKTMDWFKPIIKDPSKKDLDQLFDDVSSGIVFYGHQHQAGDIYGRIRYVNLGSAGCYHKSESRIGILEIKNGEYSLHKETLQYDDDGLMEEFESRKVPAREFITKVFIKRK